MKGVGCWVRGLQTPNPYCRQRESFSVYRSTHTKNVISYCCCIIMMGASIILYVYEKLFSSIMYIRPHFLKNNNKMGFASRRKRNNRSSESWRRRSWSMNWHFCCNSSSSSDLKVPHGSSRKWRFIKTDGHHIFLKEGEKIIIKKKERKRVYIYIIGAGAAAHGG